MVYSKGTKLQRMYGEKKAIFRNSKERIPSLVHLNLFVWFMKAKVYKYCQVGHTKTQTAKRQTADCARYVKYGVTFTIIER